MKNKFLITIFTILLLISNTYSVSASSLIPNLFEGVNSQPPKVFFSEINRLEGYVMAGDAKIDNQKYKAEFATKAKMLSFEEAEPLIGHAVGGVCPFAVNDGVRVYLDESLKRFETVFPAAGSASSAVELTIPELEKYSSYVAWVDVSKLTEVV